MPTDADAPAAGVRVRLRRGLVRIAQYGAIIVITLVIVDLACMALNLFPPTYEYGDPDVGWLASAPTGRMREDRCTEYSTGTTYTYLRNEDAVRTDLPTSRLLSDSTSVRIAITGDSQTDLCAPNDSTHAGVLQRELRARRVPALALAYGAGRYSPVQDYVVFKKTLLRYRPTVLVLNLYTGNDFYDILRVDDRPHFVPTGAGYAIAPPTWFLYDDPAVKRRSRVLFALHMLAKKTGIRGFLQRVRILRASAAEQGKGLGTVLAYMNDLRKSSAANVGYPGAFSAQMLNQQLFFHRFPNGRDEAVRRVRALLELVRREHPDLTVLLSPLPSYQLVQQQPVDDALRAVLARLPLTYEGGVQQERALYDTLQGLAAATGWLFADNLTALRAYTGTQRLYNSFDYHLLPVASEIVGRTQAQVLEPPLRLRRRSPARISYR